jgi:hypothetical protein
LLVNEILPVPKYKLFPAKYKSLKLEVGDPKLKTPLALGTIFPLIFKDPVVL